MVDVLPSCHAPQLRVDVAVPAAPRRVLEPHTVTWRAALIRLAARTAVAAWRTERATEHVEMEMRLADTGWHMEAKARLLQRMTSTLQHLHSHVAHVSEHRLAELFAVTIAHVVARNDEQMRLRSGRNVCHDVHQLVAVHHLAIMAGRSSRSQFAKHTAGNSASIHGRTADIHTRLVFVG